MDNFLDITRALADGSRIQALLHLRRGELCVCQIIELLGLAPSTVSRHMSVLYQAGLVRRRKAGKWQYYRLAGKNAPPMVQEALGWVDRSLGHSQPARSGAKKLREVLKKEKEELCCHYRS